jgi:hypothetical protein
MATTLLPAQHLDYFPDVATAGRHFEFRLLTREPGQSVEND